MYLNYEKLHSRINHMINYESDDFFVNINLKKEISDRLLDYQFLHVFNLMTALSDFSTIFDGSDPGTGKTYTTTALCKQLNLRPFIICSKIMISKWRYVCKYFNVNPLGIINYESIKLGKLIDKYGNRVNCDFIETITLNGEIVDFHWKIPKYCILVFDEVHKCKNRNSMNGKLLLSAKNSGKIIMLSATISETPKDFHIFGFMIDLYKNLKQGNNWIKGALREDSTYIGMTPKLSSINRQIFPSRGSRMMISELGNKFPENKVTADSYDIDEQFKEIVNKSFEMITDGNSKIKSALENNNNARILGEIIKARRQIEDAKIYVIEELIKEYIYLGYSVVVFLNFRSTIQKLAKIFNTKSIIQGNMDPTEQEDNLNKFQNNETNIIICSIKCNEGIDLHDLKGRKRVSLISPPFSSTCLKQTLGRIYRAGTLSNCLQKIIFCSGTVEEIICNRIKEKLNFLAKLNDNDLTDITITNKNHQALLH